jgi:GT2 family glycosyltransferase
VDYAKPFNYSAINNFGAKQARGEHLLMLNNDTEVITPDWLRSMLEHSQRPEVGVVGAKLLYPDDTIQHAGVIIDRHVVAMHPHQFLPANHPGYAARPHLLQNLSAVTFACAMTRRDVFEQLHGLNETDLPICFNDVDYCLRAREKGYLVVFTPYAVLRHFESKSRGFDETTEKQVRFRAEFDYMQKRHADILAAGDPYYNPNLSLGVQSGFHADPYYAEGLPL